MDFNILSSISKKINESGVIWGIGASVLLCFHNLVELPRDIDIIVSEQDVQKLHPLLIWVNTSNYLQRNLI